MNQPTDGQGFKFGMRPIFGLVICLAMGFGFVLLTSEIIRSPWFRLGPNDMSHLRGTMNRPETPGAPWPRSTQNLQTLVLGICASYLFAGPAFYYSASKESRAKMKARGECLFQPLFFFLAATGMVLFRGHGRNALAILALPFLVLAFVLVVYGLVVFFRGLNEGKLDGATIAYWFSAQFASVVIPVTLYSHFDY